MSSANDEINLLDILSRIGLFFKGIFSSTAIFFKKNLLLICIFSLLGTSAGYVRFLTSPPIYQSEMVVSSNYLQNDFSVELVEILQSYIKDNSPELLAEKLEIKKEHAEKIRLIEYSNFNENLTKVYKNKDTVELGRPFRIKVLVSDNAVLGPLETSLINYFNNNPFVKRNKEIKLYSTRSVVDKIESDISQIDSLKGIIGENIMPRGVQGGFVFGQPLDPIPVYKEGLRLYKEKLNLESEFKILSDNINIYTHLEPRNKPYRPILLLDLLLGLVIGSLAGFSIAALKTLLRKN